MRTEDQPVPRVSVVIPAYNVSGYIRATLDSLLNQTLANIEIIVVDDCSTDDTAAVVESYTDSRVRLLRQPVNGGPAVARAAGYRVARAEYIAVLDSDDVAMPTRLERQAAALDNDPELGLVGSQVLILRDNGELIPNRVSLRPLTPAETNIGLLFRNTVSSLWMARKSVLPESVSTYPLAEDYDFNVQVADRCKIVNLEEPLTQVRIRESGLTLSKTEVMYRYIKEVMRDQLRKLGIEPTPRELELNRHIGGKTLPVSRELLMEIERWLLRLAQANRQIGRYPHEDFLHQLALEWFEVCRFAASIGPAALYIWWRSELNNRYWHPSPKKLLKFFVRCLLRHKQVGNDIPPPSINNTQPPAA